MAKHHTESTCSNWTLCSRENRRNLLLGKWTSLSPETGEIIGETIQEQTEQVISKNISYFGRGLDDSRPRGENHLFLK